MKFFLLIKDTKIYQSGHDTRWSISTVTVEHITCLSNYFMLLIYHEVIIYFLNEHIYNFLGVYHTLIISQQSVVFILNILADLLGLCHGHVTHPLRSQSGEIFRQNTSFLRGNHPVINNLFIIYIMWTINDNTFSHHQVVTEIII